MLTYYRYKMWMVVCVALALVISLTASYFLFSHEEHRAILSSDVPVRMFPLVTRTYPLPGACSDKEMKSLSSIVRPHFGRSKIPISIVYHCLRVWGPDVPFDQEAAFEPAVNTGVYGKGLF